MSRAASCSAIFNGCNDIVTTNEFGRTVDLFFNQGKGTFEAQIDDLSRDRVEVGGKSADVD
jgi:hypothetical protein